MGDERTVHDPRVGPGRATSTAGRAPARPPVSLLIGVAGLAALVLVAVVVATRSDQPVERYGSDTPEGTVQAFLEAVDSADTTRAWGLLSTRARREMPLSQYGSELRYMGDRAREVVVERVTQAGDRATLHLLVTNVSEPGLFDQGRWTSETVVHLVREEGAWRIEEPWFIY